MRRFSLVAVILATLAAASLLAAAAPSLAAQPNAWARFNVTATSLAFYQVNGTPLLLVLPDHVLSHYALLKSPYPYATSAYVVEANGTEELVLQYMNTVYIYEGLRLVAEYTFTGGWGPGVEDLQGVAVAFGSHVIYDNRAYNFTETNVYPVVVGGRLYALFSNATGLYITDGNRTWLVYPQMVDVVGAYGMFGEVYVLAALPYGGTVYIVNRVGQGLAGTEVSGILSATVDRAWAFLPGGYFLASSPSALYVIGFNISATLALGDTLAYGGGLAYVLQGGEIYAIDPLTDSVAFELPAPQPGLPSAAAASAGGLALAYSNALYVSTYAPSIVVRFFAPSQAYAGHPFNYSVYVQGATNVTVLLNGVPVPPSGTAVVNRTGVSVFEVFASNNVSSAEYEFYVDVLPAPIYLRLNVSGNVTPFSLDNLTVYAIDELTGRPVVVPCNITVGGLSLRANSSEPVEVRLEPQGGRLAVNFTAECGGGVYSLASLNLTIPLEPARAELAWSYLGDGRLAIYAVAPGTNVTVPGYAAIYINGSLVGLYRLPALVNLSPGLNVVEVKFSPSTNLYARATYVLYAAYLGNVTSAPATVTVANVVEVVNRTVPVPQYVYVTVRPPRPFSPAQEVLLIAAGLVGGLAAGALAREAIARAGRKGAAEADVEQV